MQEVVHYTLAGMNARIIQKASDALTKSGLLGPLLVFVVLHVVQPFRDTVQVLLSSSNGFVLLKGLETPPENDRSLLRADGVYATARDRSPGSE